MTQQQKYREVLKLIKEIDDDIYMSKIADFAKRKQKYLYESFSLEIEIDNQIENDFERFIKEKIIETEEETTLRLDEIYYEYQLWFKNTHAIVLKCPSRKELKLNITKVFGDKTVSSTNKNAWNGLKINEAK